ncbi:MAG: Flavoredoxin [bacterium P3]|mgnify:CR=1 FL=1|nr:MAG: Flavoredoxin [bacterium P3]KWW40071.1 MAG: Flavoredoxin [bacterium F083]
MNVMKQNLFFFAGAALLFAACGTKQEDNPVEQLNALQTMEIKNVDGRENMGAKLYVTPQPALMIATYDESGKADVMMAAWGGQYSNNQVCFSLSKHKTTDNLRLNKAFTLSYADARTIVQSDFFGIVSGNDVPDKVEKAGFTVTPSPNVKAPIINEYPLTMECRVVEMHDDPGGGAWVVGEIVNASADPSILTDGKIDIRKLNPVAWDASSLNYFTLGDSVGKAWHSGMALK